MANYFLPNSIPPRTPPYAGYPAGNYPSNGSNYSYQFPGGNGNQQQIDLDASKEYGRGSPFTRPPGVFGPGVHDHHHEPSPPPGRYPCLAKYEVSMKIRRRIPGCGINEYDRFDEPVPAERSPLHPTSPIFNEERSRQRTYTRKVSMPKARPSAALVFSSGGEGRRVHDPRFPFMPELSPLSTSSSSSSEGSPSSVHSMSQFMPLDASTFIRTPPNRPTHSRNQGRVCHYPSSQLENLSPASPGPSYFEEDEEEIYLPESPIPSRISTFSSSSLN